MKKRIISFLLCMALLAGVVPLGLFTLTASAENSGVITNVVVEYTDDLSLKVTFDEYQGTVDYYIGLCVYEKNVYVYCGGMFYSRLSENINNGRISFNLKWVKSVFQNDSYNNDVNNSFYLLIKGYNKYDEQHCKSDYIPLSSPHKNTEKTKTPLPAPGTPYFFGDGSVSCGNGMVGFDSVDGAAYYEVSVSYNGKTLAKKTVTDSYADFSEYLEENMLSKYEIKVTAYPSDPGFSASSSTAELYYAKSDELIGSAHITKNKEIVLSGQLDYLSDHSVRITGFWEAYVDGEWQRISAAEQDNYDYSMLRLKLMPQTLPGSFVTENLVGTNPNFPIIITDSKQFWDYEKYVKPGMTTYVKLGADISNVKGGDYLTWDGIQINDGNLDLDLAGYTITFHYGRIAVFYAANNARITIRDSQRHNKNGHLIDGQVVNKGDDSACPNAVLMGNITLESGNIIGANNNHTYGYKGKTLIMNGGYIQASCPVYFTNGLNDECGTDYVKWKYGIFGGELAITTRVDLFSSNPFGAAVEYNFDTPTTNYNSWKGVFTIANCSLYNITSKAKAYSVDCKFPSEVTEENKSDAIKTVLAFFPETATHTINGTFTDIYNDEVFDSRYRPLGPEFTTGHIISTPDEATLGDLDFNICWPKPGETPTYLVAGEESTHYSYSISWRKQTVTNVYTDMLPTDKFESGRTYEAVITLHPRERFSFNRNDTSQKTTINGEEAFWNYSNNSFTLRLLPRDTYYNVWVGGVRVGDGNKNDVLGDGGSVKFYKKGELPKLSDSDVSGKYSDTLILNNFTMPKDCYKTGVSNPAQLYIDEDLNIVLRGNNTFDSNSIVDGIYADCRQLWFYGNGSLNIDVRNHDKTAINCPGSQISLYENVSVTAKGARGIYDPWDGAGENGVYVCENASLSCYACQTDDGHDYPALTGSFVDISDNGRLICETQYNGEAIWAWGEDYPNSYYDIKVLKKGEYTYYGDTPYTPANGLNVTGGVHESDCRYISITPKNSTPPSLKKGDFDKDGEITVTDALAALRIAAKLAPETSEDIAIGDTDNDGHVTVTDALAILRVAAKLAVSL